MGSDASGEAAAVVHLTTGWSGRTPGARHTGGSSRLVALMAAALLILVGAPVQAVDGDGAADAAPVGEQTTASPDLPSEQLSEPGPDHDDPVDELGSAPPSDEESATDPTSAGSPETTGADDADPSGPEEVADAPAADTPLHHDSSASLPTSDGGAEAETDPPSDGSNAPDLPGESPDDEHDDGLHDGGAAPETGAAEDVAAPGGPDQGDGHGTHPEPTDGDDPADDADEPTDASEPAADGADGPTDADDPEADDPEADEPSQTEPGATGTATLVRTGNALAVGNLGENEVLQVIEVLVVDGGTVRVEQIAIIVSVGSARAHSGDNVVAAGGGDGSTIATVVTGDAIAIGNASFTEIDQRLALEGGPGQTITAEQLARVEHSGYAVASSGGNRAIAGGTSTGAAGASVTTTGNAYAVGNLSEVSIVQGGTATASGGARIESQQSASVVNRGLAIADTGGNVAVAGGGDGELETGAAIAEGSVSINQVAQQARAIASGGATVEMRQGALVLNLGVAVARSGGNAVETSGQEPATAEQERAHDLATFDGFEEALLSIVLADDADLAGIGLLLQRLLSAALDEPIELWSHFSDETTTSYTDAEQETVVEMVQRALVFDLGWAWVESGGTRIVEEDHDLAASDTRRNRALAEVRSGHAFAIGNLSIVDVCQRMGINARLPGPPCEPEVESPRPRPVPGPEPVLQETTPEAPTDPAQPAPAEPAEVLDTVETTPEPEPEERVSAQETRIERTRLDGPTAVLPRTGVSAITMTLAGLLLALIGTGVLARASRPATMQRRGRAAPS